LLLRLKGAKEIGFTVFSISISLIAVFIPILMMSGIVGRIFREFAITLSSAIVISMMVSLTTTPMMCVHLLKDESCTNHGRFYRASESLFARMLSVYRNSLAWVLEHPSPALVVLLLIINDHRHCTPHWHCQKERHHDDRFRCRGGTGTRQEHSGRDLRGL
jgi:multidrug efflux pump